MKELRLGSATDSKLKMREKLQSKSAPHGKPQLYRHKYCLVCMTGLMGCRWHRYQQSTRASRKRDLAFFSIILVSFLHIIIFFHFWLVSRNNVYHITVMMYHLTKTYFPWNGFGLALSSVMLAYFVGLVILCLFHVHFGHQLYIHPFHLMLLFFFEASCIILSILLEVYWRKSWGLTIMSLQVYSPYFQVLAVVILTTLGWLVVRQWFRLSPVFKILWLPLTVMIMLAFYLAPFWIKSPIIISSIPEKPGIIAIGGASDIAPENTMFAFKKALSLGVTRIQTTVQISIDGVPFLLNDNTLSRTTNFEQMSNRNMSMDPIENTMSELQTLNAGSWFIENDPWGTVHRLDGVNETSEINEQRMPTLLELLLLGKDHANMEVFLMVRPLPSWHPFCCKIRDLIDGVISDSEGWFNRSNIYIPVWLYDNSTSHEYFVSVEADGKTSYKYIEASSLDLQEEIEIQHIHGHMSIVPNVDSHWLLSVVWCAGADLIATHYTQHTQRLFSPILYLDPTSYMALWVSVDFLSVVIIVILFIIHRIRVYGTKFSPESISLNTGRTKASYRSRTMKEKLLRECTVVDSMDELEARDNDGMESQPVYATCEHKAYSLSSLAGTNVIRNFHRDRTKVSGLTVPVTISNRYSV